MGSVKLNPKLKRIAAGDYIYDNRFYIQDFGYNRVKGGRDWNVSDKNAKRIACADTLKDAVHLLEEWLTGKVRSIWSGETYVA